MNVDKRKLYIAAGLLPLVPLLVGFVPDTVTARWLLAAVMAAAAVAVAWTVKKRSAPQREYRQVRWLLPLFAAVAVMLLYLTGLRFGFARVSVQPRVLWQSVLPWTLSVVSTELLRRTLLQQKNRLAAALCMAALIIAECVMLRSGRILGNLSSFMQFMGMVLLPAVTANILEHFISARYGALPNICYRLVVTLYAVLLPVVPNVPDAMLAFARILLPLCALVFIRTLYSRRKFTVSRRSLLARVTVTGILVVFMTVTMMLISCRFHYGMLVIATESMTGTINKGDAIVFEACDREQILEKEQVAVFQKDGTTYVHRIVDVQYVNGELRYYTKGDANPAPDTGYITSENIVGTAELTIQYIGYPTLWLRALLNR